MTNNNPVSYVQEHLAGVPEMDDEEYEYNPSQILQYFDYHHLLPHLAEVSELFYNLAVELDKKLPQSAEKTVALRKLLESKDAAVRAVI